MTANQHKHIYSVYIYMPFFQKLKDFALSMSVSPSLPVVLFCSSSGL